MLMQQNKKTAMITSTAPAEGKTVVSVNLASIFAKDNKKVLLLDEPVTGLDSASSEEMYNLIKKLNASGMAIIMISHDIDRSLCEAKHILNLTDNGFFFGTVSEYREYAKGDK